MTERPNVLLIQADQLTAFALKAYGGQVCRTPNIDRLATEGVVFEEAYCNYPLCAPSRFAMMTGRLPSKIGAWDNGAELPAGIPTFAHVLRAAGYYTCLSGKMHFVGPDQHHGFEERLTTEIYPADFSWTPTESYGDLSRDEEARFAAGTSSVESVLDAGPKARTMQIDYDEEVCHRALQELYLLARHGDRPFALTVSFTQPHDPYVTTDPYWERHPAAEIDSPRTPFVPLDERDPHSRTLFYHYGQDRQDLSEEDCRRARRGYYGMIAYIDDQIGRLLAALEETGFAGNTVVIVTSDHGDMLGERGMWFKKTLFEPAVRVPLIFWAPTRFAPRRVPGAVSLVDLLPTLAGLGGSDQVEGMEDLDGEDLSRCLLGQARPGNDVFCEHIDGGTQAPRIMLRRGPWKLVTSRAYPPQLFNLAQDPQELCNLADSERAAGTLAELEAAVDAAYDLDRLPGRVVADQKRRRLVERALCQGRRQAWHTSTLAHQERWFVRRGDAFPQVERRGYLTYPSS